MFSVFISILQVFHRLGPIGVCESYDRTLAIIQELSRNSEDIIVKALKAGFHLRVVGDNINFWVKVRDERKGHHSHMEHYFGNIAIINILEFSRSVNGKASDPAWQHYCSRCYSKLGWCFSFEDYSFICMKVTAKYISFFKFLGINLPGCLTDEYTEKISDKTRVIPLPALHKNESHYTDVVDIMSYYVTLLQRVYQNAGISEIPKTQVGGDLLPRVMMSGS